MVIREAKNRFSHQTQWRREGKKAPSAGEWLGSRNVFQLPSSACSLARSPRSRFLRASQAIIESLRNRCSHYSRYKTLSFQSVASLESFVSIWQFAHSSPTLLDSEMPHASCSLRFMPARCFGALLKGEQKRLFCLSKRVGSERHRKAGLECLIRFD
jgi:hypothetical protein